jgi:hypothetical protein
VWSEGASLVACKYLSNIRDYAVIIVTKNYVDFLAAHMIHFEDISKKSHLESVV